MICPLIVVFTIFLANASPASAADAITFYDYRDFESDFYIDGDNDIVYVDLPTTWFYYKVNTSDLSYVKQGYWTAGQSVTVYLQNGYTTHFSFYPFGTPFDLQFSGGSTVSGNFLDLEDLPEGSTFYYTIELYANWNNVHIVYNDDPISSSIYVDSDGKVVSDYDNDIGVTTYTSQERIDKVFTSSIRQVGGAKGFAFGHQPFTCTYNNSASASQASLTFNIKSVQLILSIPSLYRMREQSAVTNGLLKQILEALDASSGGASGAFNDSVNGVTGELGSLGDKLSGVERPAAGDINTDISDYVDSSANKQFYGVFDVFWESPLILNMLMVTLTLVTCSYVLFGKKG